MGKESMAQVIALSGWRSSGKDFGASYLVDTYGYQRLALADTLKDRVAEQFNIPRHYCDDRVLKEAPLMHLPVESVDGFSDNLHKIMHDDLSSGYWTPRALCILMGSICRSVEPNYWVKQIIRTIQKNPHMNYVITDVRYKNEIRVLEAAIPGIIVARVNRSEAPLTSDPSETDLNDWEFRVSLDNRSSPDNYYRQLDILADDGTFSKLADGNYLRFE